MSLCDLDDRPWNAAWEWVVREHEQRPLGEAAHAELVAWLNADPANLKSYRHARRIWLAVVLVPSWRAAKFSERLLVN